MNNLKKILVVFILSTFLWAFSHFKNMTLAVLTGFMIGALNKVWPWKMVVSYREDRHGELVPLMEKNVLPQSYEILSGESSQLLLAIICSCSAMFVVVLLSYIADRNEKRSTNRV